MEKKKSTQDIYKSLTSDDKKKHRKWFWLYARKYRYSIVIILFATSLLIVQRSLIPMLTQMLIDDWLPTSIGSGTSEDAIRAIIGLLSGVAGLVIVKVFATFLSVYVVRKFEQNIEMDLKLDIYKKVMKLDVKFFDKHNEGFLLSRMSNDTKMAAEYARFVPENILTVIVSFALNLSFMFTYNWEVSLAAVGILLLLFISSKLFRPLLIRSWGNIRENSDSYNQFLVNSFAGIRETKAYVYEENEIKNYLKVASSYKAAWRNSFLLYGKWMSSNAFLLGILTTTILSIGSWQVIEGNLTIGQFTALTLYGGLIVEPINKLLAVFDIFIRGTVSIFRIYDMAHKKEEPSKKKLFVPGGGSIEFKDVHLSYGENMHALRGVSFKINPGEKVAFVGTTGSGKSTILKSLVKFYNPQKGKIYIDDQDISALNLKSIRENITLMSQEPYIFFDSVRRNILFGSYDVSENKYNEVVQNAQAKSFIQGLPEKDNTNIGPRGIALSGGQKQRVALARAFLKNSNILLLDEATSALDNKTEKMIRKEVDLLAKDRTVIYVAHRLTTIEHVDRIFVLSQGQIVESGSHRQLLKSKGHYYSLVKSKSNI